MTEKKETILLTALRLFSEQGYESTSTSLIAREAGVSEGLIFRHFTNKEGLLLALLDLGKQRMQPYVERIAGLDDPKAVIASLIDMPVQIMGAEAEFWRLQLSLKWITKVKSAKNHLDGSMQPLFTAAVQAFAQLGYADPEREAQLIYVVLDGMSHTLITLANTFDFKALTQLLKSKYQVD
jgi:AcrR family transcriptional regulator